MGEDNTASSCGGSDKGGPRPGVYRVFMTAGMLHICMQSVQTTVLAKKCCLQSFSDCSNWMKWFLSINHHNK